MFANAYYYIPFILDTDKVVRGTMGEKKSDEGNLTV